MALTSLKQNDEHEAMACEPYKFGYGTEIYLNGEQVEAMGLKRLAAGQEVTIRATGIVTSSTEELESGNDSGGKDMCFRIQLTAAEVRPTGTANAARAAAILYGEDDE